MFAQRNCKISLFAGNSLKKVVKKIKGKDKVNKLLKLMASNFSDFFAE